MPLAASLLLLCAWPKASIAQATPAYAVVAWGYNLPGQTALPLAAQSGVTAIAAGTHHTVALKNDGTLVAWGHDEYGPVTGSPTANAPHFAISSPVTLGGEVLRGVTAIAAGYGHTVALNHDGSVVAWGMNGNGGVTGTPTTIAPYSATASPVTLGGQILSGVTAIAAGNGHTVALKNDGSVVAWGRNDEGQTRIPLLAQSGVTAIAAGGDRSVALKNDGSVVVWGLNTDGQRTVPVAARSGVRAIAAGSYHTVALKDDGSVVAWGYNIWGQTTVPIAARSGVTAIAAGWAHTVALKNDGSIVAWGLNDYGQTTVPVAARSGATAIAACGNHTVALVIPTAPSTTMQPVAQTVSEWRSASFAVEATGYPLNYQWRKDGVDLAGATSATYSLPFAHTNQAGSYTVVVSNPLGSVTSAPPAMLTVNPAAAGTVVAWGNNVQATVPIAAQSGVTAIAAGGMCAFRSCDTHTVVLKSDGSVVDWGSNVTGENWRSNGETTVPVAAQSGVTAVAAGANHTLAVKDDGTVVAWGDNGSLQVTGTPPNDAPDYAIASPVTLEGQVLSGVTEVAAGWEHSVAVMNDGTLVVWGGAASVPVGAESGVRAIAASGGRTVALKNDGSVVGETWTWTVPPAAAQSGVVAIAAGFDHTLALKNDGTVVAWGYNHEGAVTGTPTDIDPYFATASPVTLEGQVLSGVTAIAAGWGYSVALMNDGTLVAWGDNSYGQVTGTPTQTNHAIANPVTLGGQVLSRVTAIAAGPYHTVALIGGLPLLPSLKVRPNGHELILSWPTNAAGFALQSTLDLTPPITWLDSTNLPAVIGAHFTLTNSTSGDTRFYRLRNL